MIFDLFHSVSDPVVAGKSIGSKRSFEGFLDQVQLAEALGIDTVWLAESHFSSEVQKKSTVATIPQFFGEVGLNADSFQLIQLLAARTETLNFGTGIHNIVGGSGGPIASADRANSLRFFNGNLWESPREIRLGVAAGRFPYQNTPFGIVARNELERDFWPIVRRNCFLEALEIFLRLLKGEVLGSDDMKGREVSEADVRSQMPGKVDELLKKYRYPVRLEPRWEFEPLQLVPKELDPVSESKFQVVLGSADPEALTLAYRHWCVDLFNLSFTPPEQIEKLHEKMAILNSAQGATWSRSRLPRTVMVFIDRNRNKARELANFVLDAYVEAMRGTAAVPDKKILLERALIGDASEVRDQLDPTNPRRFHDEDRLMLWFEFNQLNSDDVKKQMTYFFDDVVSRQ